MLKKQKPPPKIVAVKEEHVAMTPNRKDVNISVSEALAKYTSDIPYVCATLSCGICGHKSPFLLCAVFRKEKLKQYREPVWLSTEFICAFLVLQAHESHLQHPSSSQRIILFHCQHHQQDDITTFCTCTTTTESIITYAHKLSHYCLLQVDVLRKVIIVHDGYQEKIEKWLQHAHYVLKKFRLVPVDSISRRVISTTNSRDSFEMSNLKDDKWRMVFSGRFKQADGHSCGPLCCATAWELFLTITDLFV